MFNLDLTSARVLLTLCNKGSLAKCIGNEVFTKVFGQSLMCRFGLTKNYSSDHSTFYLGGSSSEWSDVDSEEALDSNLDFLYGPGTVWERDSEDSGSGSGSGSENGDDSNYDDDDDDGTTDSESDNTEDSSSSATLTRPGNLSNCGAKEK